VIIVINTIGVKLTIGAQK